MDTAMDTDTARAEVSTLMPTLLDELKAMVEIPSVAFPGFPADPVHAMGQAVVDIFQRSGVADARQLEIPGGYPAIYAHIPAPDEAPTVLLYGHYDVQPAPLAQGWDTDPWTPTTALTGASTAEARPTTSRGSSSTRAHCAPSGAVRRSG
jgi:acetylornithine deacetylase/succinyl-diaminopimelate desuccinylase-like protein